MRALFLVTASLVTASAIMSFVACSSSTPLDAAPDGSSSSSNDDGGGGSSSGNPPGPLGPGDPAQIILSDGQESSFLRVSGYGIQLDAGVETWGIVVELQRRTLTDGGYLQTSDVNLEIANKTPQYKYDIESFYWPRPIVGTHDYGQEIDTWGIDLVPGDVTPSTFAAKLAVKKAGNFDGGAPGPITGIVQALKVAVWFADGDDTHCTKTDPPGVDAGSVKHAPNGCTLYSTGLLSGSKAEIIARPDIPGAVDWTNPSGALGK
jgi:hypothetical protein